MHRRGVRPICGPVPLPPRHRHRQSLQRLLAPPVRADAPAAAAAAGVIVVVLGGKVRVLPLDAGTGHPEVEGPDAAVCACAYVVR